MSGEIEHQLKKVAHEAVTITTVMVYLLVLGVPLMVGAHKAFEAGELLLGLFYVVLTIVMGFEGLVLWALLTVYFTNKTHSLEWAPGSGGEKEVSKKSLSKKQRLWEIIKWTLLAAAGAIISVIVGPPIQAGICHIGWSVYCT